ncbi:MAG TPA: hypothetical protein VMW24_03555 [Sedimentisphaerales bacterium]|nr:hypothetical protein [Sedimentisphaerales bacterium]
MSAVVAGTKAKLQDLLPGRIGDNKAFSDSYVESLIMAGFNDVAERCELVRATETISMLDDTLVYDLDSSFINITSVAFLPDGGDEDGILTVATLDDLDRKSRKWRDDRGTRPEYYTLLSAPGIPETSTDAADGSQILVYRALSDATDAELRIYGVAVGGSTTNTSEDIQRMCLVPYTMAQLKAIADPRSAHGHYDKFLEGCEKVRARYGHKYTETIGRGAC